MSDSNKQGVFTDKPLTTAGGRQEAINKTKESWNENVADPLKQTMDKAQHRSEEASKDNSTSQQQGMFTDKPLTTAGGRQEAINKTKESWNENVADPLKRTMDKGEHRAQEGKEQAKESSGYNQQHGMFTDKPLTTPEGRQEAINKTKESWNENVADPLKRTMEKGQHRADENKEQFKDKTGQEKTVLQDLKDKTNENIIEPMQRGYEAAKEKISETFSSSDSSTNKVQQKQGSLGQENKPMSQESH